MPPQRTFTPVKPVKTERTHEENQERAYIAASRRSDRSLEARIESARRASEIHKKRTGRALRVTEQDVVNEEMYEEEDDDLPAQYQRLSAHLFSGSLDFNRRLNDYITTQAAVRNCLMPQFQSFGTPMSPTALHPSMTQQMLPPSMFGQAPPMSDQQQQHQQHQQQQAQQQQQQQQLETQASRHPQQGFRQHPYMMPQRPQLHQRSASIPPTPQHMANFQQSIQQPNPPAMNQQVEDQRRMSLPPQALQHVPSKVSSENSMRPTLSRSTTSQSNQQVAPSPLESNGSSGTPPSTHGTPPLQQELVSPISPPFMTPTFSTSVQAMNINPLSLSLPPEAQQFVGSALDPNDPRTSLFMAGSEHLPQPYPVTYTYNPNGPPKSARPASTAIPSPACPTYSAAPTTDQRLASSETTHVSASMDDMPSTVLSSMVPWSDMALFDPLSTVDHPNQANGNQGHQEEFDSSKWFNDAVWEPQS